jgi:DNA polymerase-1
VAGKTSSKTENTSKANATGGRSRLFLIDSMSYIFRAYHALPRLTNHNGLSTHAVYGFNNMIKKLLDTYHPEYVGAAFDLEGPTFRHESFANYKANREEMPADLGEQIPYVRQLLEALRIPVLSHPGFEADDVIGTLARQAAEHDIDVFIVSGDKDMMQLVGDHVSVLNPMKDDLISDPAKVVEVLGVPPDKVTDLMALQGDAVDNIPGAPGIGPKGAQELIQTYGSVEACLEHAAEVKGKRSREALLNFKEQILLSKQLATIHTNAPVTLSLDEVRLVAPDREKLKALYQEMEFSTLLRALLPEGESGPKDYAEFQSEDEVSKFIVGLKQEQVVAIAASKEDDSAPMLAGLQVALSVAPGQARIVPFEMLDALKPWLEDESATKAAHDVKAAMLALGKRAISLAGAKHDTMLYSFLLDANEGDHNLPKVTERRFSIKLSDSLAEDADFAGRLVPSFLPEIQSQELERIYNEI